MLRSIALNARGVQYRILSRNKFKNLLSQWKLSSNTSAKASEVSMAESRAARRAKLGAAKKSESISPRSLAAWIGGLGIIGAIAYSADDIKRNPNGALSSYYNGSLLQSGVEYVFNNTFGAFQTVFEPVNDKLLPDFPDPEVYPGVPPGTPPPPLLVVDLEKTLIGSVYDSQHGWRHVKRPGVDKFIKDLSQYYEIVIFSENDIGISMDIITAIDPDNRCHRFGASHGEARGTHILKRLDLMNRDMGQIILIDDSEVSAQLCNQNTLFVKPFTNIHDIGDSVLFDLIPLLQAFVHDQVKDFRTTIDDLGTRDAQEAAIEYRMRLQQRKSVEHMKRNKGLGGYIRGGSKEVMYDGSVRSSILSPKDIVGGSGEDTAAPIPATKSSNPLKKEEPAQPVVKKKGKLMSYIGEQEKNREEENMRKIEKLNEMHAKRQMSRMQAAEQQQQQQ